jgi:photosystem II stability/assembly factor-like uncharacterized protein
MNIINCPVFLLFFQLPFACNDALEYQASSQITASQQVQESDKTAASNIVFKSTDGGQTWQDISEGLPKSVQDDGGNVLVKDDNGLWLTAGNGIYHSKPNSTSAFWTKEVSPNETSNIAPGKAGIFAYNYWGGRIFQKTTGTDVWSPVFTNLQVKQIRSVFETSGGTIFIGSDGGFFRSTDGGKSWKQLPAGGWGKMVESNGILLVTSQRGILRSTDNGDTWSVVISEGGVGIDVATIEGGFAAITYSTVSETRRIRTSYDGGKTWQAIDAGLQAHGFVDPIPRPFNASNSKQGFSDSTWHAKEASNPQVITYITTIVQVGDNFFCGHTDGIYRSSDKGKTWKLLVPAEKGKMFKLFVSGNVIYGIQTENHC